MKTKQSDPMVTVTIRVPVEMRDRVAIAAEDTGKDQAEIYRRAIMFGLEDMELVGFDAEAVYRKAIEAARNTRAKSKPLESLPNPHPGNKHHSR